MGIFEHSKDDRARARASRSHLRALAISAVVLAPRGIAARRTRSRHEGRDNKYVGRGRVPGGGWEGREGGGNGEWTQEVGGETAAWSQPPFICIRHNVIGYLHTRLNPCIHGALRPITTSDLVTGEAAKGSGEGGWCARCARCGEVSGRGLNG